MSMQTLGRSARMERAFDRVTDSYPVEPGTRTFSAARVYDKVGVMVVLALITGTVSYLSNSPGLILLGFLAGLVFSLIGIFKPNTAKVVAPLYALAEGLALGGISAYYATTSGSGIIPLAIIFTAGIFVGALVVFRSGLVKVTPKFASMTLMALIGFVLVSLALAFGLPVPGLSGTGGLAILGVFGILIGVAVLFMDFNFVQIGEQRGLPADLEWFGALQLMISLVFVYLNVLRVLGRRR